MTPLERLALAEAVLSKLAVEDYRGNAPASRAEALRYFERVDADSTETGRELLERLGPVLKPARDLRYVPDDDFDDVAEAELEVVERHLHAIAYSCQQGASKMRRIIVSRAAAEASRSSE